MIKRARISLIVIFLSGVVLTPDAFFGVTRDFQELPDTPPGFGAILVTQTLVRTPDEPQEDSESNELIVRSTTLVVGVFALGIFLFMLHRLASSYGVDNPDEKAIDAAVAAMRKRAPDGSFGGVPRVPPNSPLALQDDIATLERQIEVAAEACTRLSRTIGLIYFETPVYSQIEAQQGSERARLVMANLVSELRRSLRATDRVALLEGYGILVCIFLLANLSDLEDISRRLHSIVERLGLAGVAGAMPHAGLSIYPLNGYSGSELISVAREHFRRTGGSDGATFSAQDAAKRDSGTQSQLFDDNVVYARLRFRKTPPE